jgi:hypothetical protein
VWRCNLYDGRSPKVQLHTRKTSILFNIYSVLLKRYCFVVCIRTSYVVYTVLVKRLLVRFQFLTSAGMKMTAFWNMVLCTLAEVDRRFISAYCLHHQDVSFYETALLHIPEGCHLRNTSCLSAPNRFQRSPHALLLVLSLLIHSLSPTGPLTCFTCRLLCSFEMSCVEERIS